MRVIDLATLSLTGGSGIAEAKVPLWFADGTNNNDANYALGSYFLCDGGGITAPSTVNQKLFTLSSTYSASLRFAFEVSTASGSTSYSAQLELWDWNTNTAVSASLVSTPSTTATVVRSGTFTLTPGHQYGITVSGALVSDASLIIFP